MVKLIDIPHVLPFDYNKTHSFYQASNIGHVVKDLPRLPMGLPLSNGWSRFPSFNPLIPSSAFSSYAWKHACFLGRLRPTQFDNHGGLKWSIPKSSRAQSDVLLSAYQRICGRYERRYAPVQPNMEAAYKNKFRYDRDPHPEQKLPLSVMRLFPLAIDNVHRRFMSHLRGEGEMPLNEVLEELDLKKSPGYPWRDVFRTKRDFLELGEIPFGPGKGLEWHPLDVLENFDKTLSSENTAFYSFWLDKMKDEIRPIAKLYCSPGCEELQRPCRECPNKIRTFNCSPIELVVSMNRRCLRMNKRFYDMGAECNSWSTVGMTKFFGQWDRMIRKHLRIGKCNSHGLDGGQWDARMFFLLLWAVQKLRQMWCVLSDGDRGKLRMLYRLMICRIVYGEWGDVIWMFSGNPSGSSNTIVDNTLGFALLWEWVWLTLAMNENAYRARTGQEPVDSSMSSFDANVCLSLCGDDVLLTISDAVYPWFNLAQIVTTMGMWGTLIEVEDWKPRPASEVVYVSNTSYFDGRFYLPCPNYERVVGCLIEASEKVSFRQYLVDPRWVLLRLYAVRIDTWGNPKCRELIQKMITTVLEDHRKLFTITSDVEEIHNGVTWAAIRGIYKSDLELFWLYTGDESGCARKTDFHFIFPESSMTPLQESIYAIRREFDATLGYPGEGPKGQNFRPKSHTRFRSQSHRAPSQDRCAMNGCRGRSTVSIFCEQHAPVILATNRGQAVVNSIDPLLLRDIEHVYVQRAIEKHVRQNPNCKDCIHRGANHKGDGPPGVPKLNEIHLQKKWYHPARLAAAAMGADRPDPGSAGARFVEALPGGTYVRDAIVGAPKKRTHGDLLNEHVQHWRSLPKKSAPKQEGFKAGNDDFVGYRKRYEEKFDSTKGYPGEGPPKAKTNRKRAKAVAKAAARKEVKKEFKMQRRAGTRALVAKAKKIMRAKPFKRPNLKGVARMEGSNYKLRSSIRGNFRLNGQVYYAALNVFTSATAGWPAFPLAYQSLLTDNSAAVGSNVNNSPLPFFAVSPYSITAIGECTGVKSDLVDIANYFEKWSGRIKISWKPSLPTTTNGQMAYFFDPDPSDKTEDMFGTVRMMTIAQQHGGKVVKYTDSWSHTFTVSKPMWLRQGTSTDLRQVIAGHFYVFAVTPAGKIENLGSDYVGSLGTFLIEYDIQLHRHVGNEKILNAQYNGVATGLTATSNVLLLTTGTFPASGIIDKSDSIFFGCDPNSPSRFSTLVLNGNYSTPEPTFVQVTALIGNASAVSSKHYYLTSTDVTSLFCSTDFEIANATANSLAVCYTIFVPPNTPISSAIFDLTVTVSAGETTLDVNMWTLESTFFTGDYDAAVFRARVKKGSESDKLMERVQDYMRRLRLEEKEQEFKEDTAAVRTSLKSTSERCVLSVLQDDDDEKYETDSDGNVLPSHPLTPIRTSVRKKKSSTKSVSSEPPK